MGNKIKDGGPAFPRQHTSVDANSPYFKPGHEGMTLRDYFAGKAMQGFMANDAMIARYAESGRKENINPDALMATSAYAVADAMLAAREGKS